MRTYPEFDENNVRRPSFEIDVVYIGIPKICKILAKTGGVSSVVRRSPFSKATDIHVEFQYNGAPFIVLEMYGDSSRYWIGPAITLGHGMDVSSLEMAFGLYRPPLLVKLIGDILTLRFLQVLRGK